MTDNIRDLKAEKEARKSEWLKKMSKSEIEWNRNSLKIDSKSERMYEIDMKTAAELLERTSELFSELKTYHNFKRRLLENIRDLERAYQEKRYGYFEFKERLDALLQGRTKKEAIENYDAYINSLISKINYFNDRIFYIFYNEGSLSLLKDNLIRAKEALEKISTEKSPTAQKGQYEKEQESKEEKHEEAITKKGEKEERKELAKERAFEWDFIKIPKKGKGGKYLAGEDISEEEKIKGEEGKGEEKEIERKKLSVSKLSTSKRKEKESLRKEKKLGERTAGEQLAGVKIFSAIARAVIMPFAFVFASLYALSSKRRKDKRKEKKQIGEEAISATAVKPEAVKLEVKPSRKIRITPLKVRGREGIAAEKSFLKTSLKRDAAGELLRKRHIPKRESIFSGILKIGTLRGLRKRIEEEQRFLASEDAVPITVELLPEEKKEILEKTYLKREAERIKKIIERERIYSSYRPSTFAAIANLSVKRISVVLLERFPSFFKNFYNDLRAANIKILSNTYINIMVLFTIVALIISSIASMIIFYILYNPLYLILIKGFGVGITAAFASFMIFYLYPKFEVRSRSRSIKANMPFAVNHMAAIAASGSPPITIFKLIASTAEYGEVSKEFEKIVDYVEIFGFDLTSAIKSVASTTPSPQLKEMLEGLISAIESGADVKTFLREKSDESMNTYRLELQKYNETLTTYSDVYTGVLIAAPLFFVITLTLVNLLGGRIGGFDITTLMLLGTYLLIPILNITFLIFLQASQPEI